MTKHVFSAILLSAALAATALAQGPRPELDLPGFEDPAVAAILETNPTTPAECARAAKIFADLHEPEYSKQFLQKVLDAKLKPAQLVELADKFGAEMFINMGARPELQPEAGKLADAVLKAVTTKLEDPKRIDTLIDQLDAPSADSRGLAIDELARVGPSAVGPLLGALADPQRAGVHQEARAALIGLGSEAVGPLLAAVQSEEPTIQAEAARALAALDAPRAVLYLPRPFLTAPRDSAVGKAAGAALTHLTGTLSTPGDAVEMLLQQSRDYLDRGQPIEGTVLGEVELWQWDAKKKQPVAKTYAEDVARRMLAARLAREAYEIEAATRRAAGLEARPEVRRYCLAAMLEAAVFEQGLDEPLPEGEGTLAAEAAALGPEAVEGVLRDALDRGHVGAAKAAARILGEIGSADQLRSPGTEPAPLVRATYHADRRVRMAALESIVGLKPTEPFAGSSNVPRALAYFVALRGSRRVLVAAPNTALAGQLGGLLAEQGLTMDSATSGSQAMQFATASPGYELALIDAGIDNPPIHLLLRQLRHDYRTADLRVGVIARDGLLPRARKAARSDPLAMAFSRAHTAEDAAWQVERLATLRPRTFVDHELRRKQADRAMDLLAKLAADEDQPFDLADVEPAVLVALDVPERSVKAAEMLGHINSVRSQRALVDRASLWSLPVEIRKAAADAFCRSVERYGILLTTDQIARQYERYNQSETLDRDTQRVLAQLLDCIETPAGNRPRR